MPTFGACEKNGEIKKTAALVIHPILRTILNDAVTLVFVLVPALRGLRPRPRGIRRHMKRAVFIASPPGIRPPPNSMA